MRRIAILLFAFISALSTYCQTNILDGDLCFDKGDYTCAETKYNEEFKLANGKDKQIAEIKLTRTKWCSDHLKSANQAFSDKNYTVAKENYQSVLESNPKDVYAKTQLDKCVILLNLPAPPTLRKATSADLSDIWNNKYGVLPERRKKLIDAGIDPDDAQKRINKSEGKPSTVTNQAITLNVTKKDLSFSSTGEKSEAISVNTNASDYSVSLVPWWCSVQTYKDYFIVHCSTNYSTNPRSEWFKVRAGDKEIKIYVNQAGTINQPDAEYSTNYNKSYNTISNKKCFNCPNVKYVCGITVGYVKKSFDYTEGLQVGFRIEPLFKYGFGINTGLNIEAYSTNLRSTLNGEEEFNQYTLNIPLHLEYRLNLSKWFNIFAFGGVGFDSRLDSYNFNSSLEYGGGLRINHVQLNVSQSLLVNQISDLQDLESLSNNKYKNLILSVSYMF